MGLQDDNLRKKLHSENLSEKNNNTQIREKIQYSVTTGGEEKRV